jgi:hypothetical protein
MTDLVILYGVKWLLNHGAFPFDSYTVEYGHGNKQGFDITACANGRTLIGEAFNVAPSFFQIKKNSMLKKLRGPSAKADFKIVMFNQDAVAAAYVPKPRNNEFFVLVEVGTGDARTIPDPVLVTATADKGRAEQVAQLDRGRILDSARRQVIAAAPAS